MHEAVVGEEVDIVKLLVKHKAIVDEANLEGDTALTLALKRLTPTTLKFSAIALALVNAGANVNIRNELGLTPLHYVAKNGMIKWVQLLLAKVRISCLLVLCIHSK